MLDAKVFQVTVPSVLQYKAFTRNDRIHNISSFRINRFGWNSVIHLNSNFFSVDNCSSTLDSGFSFSCCRHLQVLRNSISYWDNLWRASCHHFDSISSSACTVMNMQNNLSVGSSYLSVGSMKLLPISISPSSAWLELSYSRLFLLYQSFTEPCLVVQCITLN